MSRRPTALPLVSTRLVVGTRAEKIRVKPGTRDGRAIVSLTLLEPLTSHSNSLATVGRPMQVPVANVPDLITALRAAAVEAGATPITPAEPALAEDWA